MTDQPSTQQSVQQTGTHAVARRTAWMEARARNAAKRGWLIAGVGMLAVAATLAALVLIPREVDRVLSNQIRALPAPADTIALAARAETARLAQQRADSLLRALRTADADRVAVAAQKDELSPTDSRPGTPGPEAAPRSELGVRVARARSAPLVESFRAVGETDLLRNDPRVRAIMDSLNDVNRDREAYAALGGADARYAALTSRIATLGQRLLLIAEQRLASTAPPRAPPSSVATSVPTSAPAGNAPPTNSPAANVPATNAPPANSPAANAPAVAVAPKVAADSAASLTDTTALAPVARFNADSVADRMLKSAFDSTTAVYVTAAQALQAARVSNAAIEKKRADTRAEFTMVIPPVAMLLAALALGLAIGYGVAFLAEVRQPRIADIAEVERVTQARVIVHGGASRATRDLRKRRKSDDAIPAVIDTVSDSYQLLHVTLTGFGDSTRMVRVLSDSPVLTATVGVNLAAAAAREARAALLVDGDTRARLAGTLLRIENATGIAEAQSAPASLSSHVVRVAVGRDQSLKALVAGSAKSRKVADKQNVVSAEFAPQFMELAKEFDLTVLLTSSDYANNASWLPAADVILCARLGSTKLNWLTRSALHLRANGVRLRAVLLWAADAP